MLTRYDMHFTPYLHHISAPLSAFCDTQQQVYRLERDEELEPGLSHQIEVEVVQEVGCQQTQLEERHVLPQTGASPATEWDEHLFELGQLGVGGEPSLGQEVVRAVDPALTEDAMHRCIDA
jgi:hypothetical protein